LIVVGVVLRSSIIAIAFRLRPSLALPLLTCIIGLRILITSVLPFAHATLLIAIDIKGIELTRRGMALAEYGIRSFLY